MHPTCRLGSLRRSPGVPVCAVEFPVEPLFVPDTSHYQDLLGGAQIQPAPLGSGTLGAIVQDANGGRVGLTCHHVVGDPGTTVWQPDAPLTIAGGGPPDLTDSIGEVIARESPATQTIPVPAGPLLLLGREIDAATVGLDAVVNQGRTISDAIADGFGAVDSTSSPNVGMFVKKRGSQTGPHERPGCGHPDRRPWLSGQPPPDHAYVMSRQYEIFYNPVGCPDGIFVNGPSRHCGTRIVRLRCRSTGASAGKRNRKGTGTRKSASTARRFTWRSIGASPMFTGVQPRWRDRDSNPGHHDFQPSFPGPENRLICRRFSRGGTLNLPVVSWRFLGVWAGRGTSPAQTLAGQWQRADSNPDTSTFRRRRSRYLNAYFGDCAERAQRRSRYMPGYVVGFGPTRRCCGPQRSAEFLAALGHARWLTLF
jgi:hypothetical protein